MRDPETAFVGEIADGAGFFGDDFAERVVGVGPPGRAEIGEDFGAVGQVHERAARAGFFKVAVAKFEQARVLFAASTPTTPFLTYSALTQADVRGSA